MVIVFILTLIPNLIFRCDRPAIRAVAKNATLLILLSIYIYTKSQILIPSFNKFCHSRRRFGLSLRSHIQAVFIRLLA
ncbi:MAG: hypothetical protein RMY33_024385 [Nostoc sp. DedQUE03]|nr:hypothetical protein [Nostoc sp. DedQUE03]MDZ8045116.1 hypothetical protein [Nostoc sp. DedQUE02]